MRLRAKADVARLAELLARRNAVADGHERRIGADVHVLDDGACGGV
jgi:hypothetical protein